MTTPLVSVVVPAYNAQAHLAECLRSVQDQVDTPAIEIIVVDDGSQDDTASIALATTGVQLIRQPNQGPSAARNRGMRASRGTWIALLDADDVWPIDKLQRQFRLIDRYPHAAMVFGNCRQFDAQGDRMATLFDECGRHPALAPCRNLLIEDGVMADAYRWLLHENIVTTGSVLLHKSVLDRIGGFAEDLRLVEDLDLWLRIARQFPIARTSAVCLRRRRHGHNISNDTLAMALAFLEVLDRQPAADPVIARMIQSLKAAEHLEIAKLALARGAWMQAWHHAGSAVGSGSKVRILPKLVSASLHAWKLRNSAHRP